MSLADLIQHNIVVVCYSRTTGKSPTASRDPNPRLGRWLRSGSPRGQYHSNGRGAITGQASDTSRKDTNSSAWANSLWGSQTQSGRMRPHAVNAGPLTCRAAPLPNKQPHSTGAGGRHRSMFKQTLISASQEWHASR
ncbi:hypothetical protein FKM82_020732 [Ascaphus truei]